MPRFSANLSFLFPELPFIERFAAASAAGFKAVEYVCLYDHQAPSLEDAAARAGVNTVLLNIPHGRWEQGERGIACHPDRVAEFRDTLAKTVTYCRETGCRKVNCLAGIFPEGAERGRLRDVFVDNLRFAASRLADSGISLLIEPINTHDMPGFFLSRTQEAISIVEEVGASNLRVQFDCYHSSMMGEDPAEMLARHLPLFGHIQIADNPGRNEPGTGKIDYRALLSEIDRLGYDGYVGCEYRPKTTTTAGLVWMAELRISPDGAKGSIAQ